MAKLNLKLNSLYVFPVDLEVFTASANSAICSSKSDILFFISVLSNFPPASCKTIRIGFIKYAIFPSEVHSFNIIATIKHLPFQSPIFT